MWKDGGCENKVRMIFSENIDKKVCEEIINNYVNQCEGKNISVVQNMGKISERDRIQKEIRFG